MNKTSYLAKNTFLIAISRISTQLVMFIMLPVYTASLTVEEYGAVDLVITYGGLLAPLIMLNIQQAIFRHLIDARSDKEMQRKIITNSLEITLIVSIVVILTYLTANLIFSIPYASIIAFYFASIIIGDLVLQISRGLGKTKAFAITGIVQGILTAILNLIFLLVLQMGVTGMLLGIALGMLIPAMVLALFMGVHKHITFSARELSTKKQLLGFSLPLMPNTISWWVYNASDRTIITLALGLAANGIYAVSNKFANIANSFSAIFYTSWSESAVLAINEPDRDEFFSKVANIMLKAFSTLGILIMCITPLVFPILVNESFNEALLYIPILILGTIFNTIVSFYSAIYIAKKLTKQVANTSMVAAIINVVVNLALIWFIGIWAAAISTAVAYASMAVYRHYDMKKYMTITYERGIFIKLVIFFGVIAVFYYMNNIWAHIAGLTIALIFAYILNHRELGLIKELALGRFGAK